jgi:hypothetical protein
MKILFSLIAFSLVFYSPSLVAQTIQKNRVLVLTDIEADPDDKQSLVRLLLYSNQIDIEGIVATTSCWKKTSIAPESIKKIVLAYGKVQANLNKHEPGFPEAADILSKVKEGIPTYGMEGVGEGKDSEGSDWIIKTLEKNDSRPLWISVWGGANTLAQALYKIEKTKTKAEAKRLISQLRVYTISDQDDSGNWIRTKFPDLFFIVSPGDDYGTATWSAITNRIDSVSNETISNSWLAKNIQQGHGPLGAQYPDVAWGVEGDTPAFLSLIPNGLNNAEYPDWGGWGGRYELYTPDFASIKKGRSDVPRKPETRAIWTNAIDSYTPFVYNAYGRAIKLDKKTFSNNKVTLWRWRDDFQNDFAARMDWCIADYDKANHPPVPVLKPNTEITVKSGEVFSLDASDTFDPDGDSFSFLWFNYPEAGTYKKEIKISPENYPGTSIIAPEVTKKETVHFILKVTDKGEPKLTRYKRVVVTVLPK